MNLRGRIGKVPKPGEAPYADCKLNPSKKSKHEFPQEDHMQKDEGYIDCEKQTQNPSADFKPAQNLVSKESLENSLSKINDSFKFEPDVLDLLLDIMEDFIIGISDRACKLAAHRASETVSVDDYKLALELDWAIRIHGMPSNELDVAQVQKPPSEDNENEECFTQEDDSKRTLEDG